MSTQDKHDHDQGESPLLGLGAALEAALADAEQHSMTKHGESHHRPESEPDSPEEEADEPLNPFDDDANDADDDMNLFAGMSDDDTDEDPSNTEPKSRPEPDETESARVLRQAAERVKAVASGGELELLRNQVKHLRDRLKDEDGRAVRAERQLEILKNDLKSTRQRFSTVAEREAELNIRIERQKLELPQKARKDVLNGILPALDSTDLLVKNLLANDALDPDVRSVVKMLEGSWRSVFNNMQIQAFDAVGQKFDPAVHTAISEVESTSIPPGMCVRQVGRGYMIEFQLMRSAQVVVSKGPPEDATEQKTVEPDA